MTNDDGPRAAASRIDEELRAAYGEDWEQRLGGTYRSMIGEVPPHVRQRWAAVAGLGRPEVIEAIERLREVAIAQNPLGWRAQQLVQFGQLLVLAQEGPARLHAAAALRHGASLQELMGVVETAFVTAGVPAFSLGVRLLDELR
ncbi:MAG TPA: carboxymuconolactone decarboxylase family protein [Solirubrobacteraceae bacterium]|nr:carboxymuconolactone decarboxylase family protein [Solirubrobacteraceae bacterium]